MKRFYFTVIGNFLKINATAQETEPTNTPARANILPLNGIDSGIINPGGVLIMEGNHQSKREIESKHFTTKIPY